MICRLTTMTKKTLKIGPWLAKSSSLCSQMKNINSQVKQKTHKWAHKSQRSSDRALLTPTTMVATTATTTTLKGSQEVRNLIKTIVTIRNSHGTIDNATSTKKTYLTRVPRNHHTMKMMKNSLTLKWMIVLRTQCKIPTMTSKACQTKSKHNNSLHLKESTALTVGHSYSVRTVSAKQITTLAI